MKAPEAEFALLRDWITRHLREHGGERTPKGGKYSDTFAQWLMEHAPPTEADQVLIEMDGLRDGACSKRKRLVPEGRGDALSLTKGFLVIGKRVCLAAVSDDGTSQSTWQCRPHAERDGGRV
jgi:hypothetical protein